MGVVARNSSIVCAIVTGLALVLAGCGGGGPGGGGAVLAPEAPEQPPCTPTHGGDCLTAAALGDAAGALVGNYTGQTGFTNQWGLRHMNAGRAYANLELLQGPDVEPGEGVTIGFIDSGIDRSHPAFAGKTVTEQFLSGARDETGATRFSHGTAVASVAAAARVSSSNAAWGVASGADVAMFSVPIGPGGGDYVPISLTGPGSFDDRWARQVDTVLGWRSGGRKVDILNLSVGYKGIIDNYAEPQLRQAFGGVIAAMAQAGAGEKTLFVWAAGNAHGDPCDDATPNCEGGAIDAVSVEVMPGLAARFPELRGHTVAAVALSPDGAIASFSNRCGIAAAYCIAAAGEAVRGAYFGPGRDAAPGAVIRGHADLDGTSLAAPMVAGGLALMRQLFRGQLSNTELVTRLFRTADDSGRYADSAVYGHGAMDLGAATSPVGVLEVPGATAAGGNGFLLRSTRLRPGAAFGDGFQHSLAGREVMARDALGAPFWYRLDSFTAAAEGPSVTARLRGFLAREPEPGVSAGIAAPVTLHAARLEASADLRGSHMALAEGGVRATLAEPGGLSAAAFTTKGMPGRRPVLGAALSWRRTGSPVGLRAGWIGEPESLLGSIGEGAFGTLAGDTSFVGVDAAADLGGWRVGANAELGVVVPEARGGFIHRASPLATSAFALHAGRAVADSGTWRFSVSQPLRVERGRARLRVPASRTRTGAVLHDAVGAGLAPSGRQTDLAGEWRQPLRSGQLRLGAVYSHRPGHRGDARPDLTVLAGWRREF